jgi:murein DD-endopeptidase MepM/ murein hydrolase activator NlpD
VSVNDSVPENKKDTDSRAVPITLETIGGNYVILDLGKGRYAMYLHMQPGKMRVKVGDKVRRGDILGLLGNSGNSDGPHLHFQICDANSPLGAEGLPFVFESFEKMGQGAITDTEANWKPLANGKAEQRRMEIPLENAILGFP